MKIMDGIWQAICLYMHFFVSYERLIYYDYVTRTVYHSSSVRKCNATRESLNGGVSTRLLYTVCDGLDICSPITGTHCRLYALPSHFSGCTCLPTQPGVVAYTTHEVCS